MAIIIERLPTFSIRTLLHELAGRYSLRRPSNPLIAVPLVNLYLKSGHTLEGWIIRVAKAQREEMVLLHCPRGDYRNPFSDVAFIPLIEICAVNVQHAGDLQPPLSPAADTALFSIPEPVNSLTKLAFKRQIAEAAMYMSKTFGGEYSITIDTDILPDNERPAMARLLDHIITFLVNIFAEPVGKQSIEALKIVGLEFIFDTKPGTKVAVINQLLQITLPIKEIGSIVIDDIKKQIEDCL
jgi:hypothetical protein